MGTGRSKSKQQETQALKDHTAAVNNIQQSPTEKLIETKNLALINALDSGKDVKEISGLAPYWNLYQNSLDATNAERYSGGVLGLGSQQANPNMIAALKQHADAKTQRDASGKLYDSVQAARAQAENNVLPWLVQQNDNRNLAKVQATGNLYSAMINRPKETPWWQQALTAGIGAAGSIFAGKG